MNSKSDIDASHRLSIPKIENNPGLNKNKDFGKRDFAFGNLVQGTSILKFSLFFMYIALNSVIVYKR